MKLLSDIGNDEILPYGDVEFRGTYNRTFLVEIKETGDLLTSISSGRLYEQLRGMSASCDIPILITSPLHALPSGFLRIGNHASNWRFSSVQGILVDMAFKGTVILYASTDFTIAATVRTIWTQVNGEKMHQIKIPKIFQFRHKELESLKVLCSFPGINVTTGEALLQRYHTLRRIANTTEEELLNSEIGLHRDVAKSIQGVLNEWSG